MSIQTLLGKKVVDISIIGKNEKAEEVFKSILLSFEGGKTLRIDPWDKENIFSFLDELKGVSCSEERTELIRPTGSTFVPYSGVPDDIYYGDWPKPDKSSPELLYEPKKGCPHCGRLANEPYNVD